MTCPDCEYHKNRAARWRAEAYKHAGHDVIERPWVGLTKDERNECIQWAIDLDNTTYSNSLARAIEAKLKEKNT